MSAEHQAVEIFRACCNVAHENYIFFPDISELLFREAKRTLCKMMV